MKITYDMVLEYPKVMDREGQPGDVDRGNAQSQHKFLRELAKNPVATVNAYFTSQEDLDSLLAVEGFEDEVTNPQTGAKSPRIKEGNPDYGIGKYIQLKRPINNIVEFVDRKTGDVKEVDKGGYPSVKILKDGAFVPYDYDTLGPITNGTESKVRFEVYGKGNTRLEAFGITNLVEWVEYEGDTQDEF